MTKILIPIMALIGLHMAVTPAAFAQSDKSAASNEAVNAQRDEDQTAEKQRSDFNRAALEKARREAKELQERRDRESVEKNKKNDVVTPVKNE